MTRISKRNLARIAAGKLPLPSEDEIQGQIADGLFVHGFAVYIASRRRKRCYKCGVYSHGGDGVSRGVADLLVRRAKWPNGVMCGLEIKRPGAVRYSSVEQKAAVACGDVALVQSLEEALAALAKAEQEMGLQPCR